MQRFVKMIALTLLALSFISLDVVIWVFLHLPFDLGAQSLEANYALISWSLLIRVLLTALLIWTFLYFRAHCVIANRKESTRIITRA